MDIGDRVKAVWWDGECEIGVLDRLVECTGEPDKYLLINDNGEEIEIWCQDLYCGNVTMKPE